MEYALNYKKIKKFVKPYKSTFMKRNISLNAFIKNSDRVLAYVAFSRLKKLLFQIL
jgi:hypothetical protein